MKGTFVRRFSKKDRAVVMAALKKDWEEYPTVEKKGLLVPGTVTHTDDDALVFMKGLYTRFEYVTVKVAANVYYQFGNKHQNMLGRAEDDEYISTDQEWARKSGLLKDEDPGFMVPFFLNLT